MARLTIALLALLCFLSSATATLAPRQNYVVFREDRLDKLLGNSRPETRKDSSSEVAKQPTDGEQKAEFHITAQTEVKLDGRPCKYEEVPKDAVIIHLEVESSSNQAILKIHFRSKK